MPQFSLEDRQDLICPICHVTGICHAHNVETWLEGQRLDHLGHVLKPYQGDRKKVQRVAKEYPTPESYFRDAILISWPVVNRYQELSLFSSTDTNTTNTTHPQHEFALFHQRGSQLLEQYKVFILDQLEQGQRIHRILKTLGTDHPALLEQASHQLDFLNSKRPIPEVRPSRDLLHLIRSTQTTLPNPLPEESSTPYQDPNKLIEEILRNLL